MPIIWLTQMDAQLKLELEAAAFRRLQYHLINDRTDVQNIDMMNLTGFCRNCLSRWYQEAAQEAGVEMSKAEAREAFYGMPFERLNDAYQNVASPEAQAKFAKNHD